jgi:arylsulfatase A-like enzyme
LTAYSSALPLDSLTAAQPDSNPYSDTDSHSYPTPTAANEPEAEGQPNILVIYTDDQRWDTLHLMPEVQKLAAQGMT